jgi:hypothetical protein
MTAESISDGDFACRILSNRGFSYFNTGYIVKIGWLIAAALLIFKLTVSAQERGSPPASTIDRTTEIDFRARLSTSSREMKWSRTYWKSYEKTSEITYLYLSAQHCRNAILLMQETQSLLPNTTRLHYVAKNEKTQACRYYEQLQSIFERLSLEHHLNAIDGNVCP